MTRFAGRVSDRTGASGSWVPGAEVGWTAVLAVFRHALLAWSVFEFWGFDAVVKLLIALAIWVVGLF